VKRGPARRRDFLDATAVQLWPAAYREQQEYERVLRHRNSLLRHRRGAGNREALEVWDERLAATAGPVLERRASTIAALHRRTRETYAALVGESDARVGIEYRSSWGGELGVEGASEHVRAALRSSRRQDLERGTTTVGPHRDEPGFWIDSREARTLASQGEQRSLAFALRLATHQAIEEQVGEPPLLLLDDVFSELDRLRRSALVGLLPTGQTFITSTHREEVPMAARVWTVRGGGLE
ncbi:MAG: DNA replication and repair protein RecF, partial [Actinomycetota bacterium]|nr:DNA replication and repair protein RecF [Actinomycetota bacterium]